MPNINPSNFRQVANITRPVTTQAETGGDSETVFVAVVTMRVMVKVKKSEEDLVAGTFRGCDYWEMWFKNPGYTTVIRQGYHITVLQFHGEDREFIIKGYYPNNENAGDYHVICETEVAKLAC